jgi:toxin ParE1/3/4
MRYEVMLTENAFYDLEDIYDYIFKHDHPSHADYVLNSMESVIESLAAFPERGSYPKELLELGIREYRQTFFKPYRVIYRIIGSIVYIMVIADGRRDMEALLTRRLLG